MSWRTVAGLASLLIGAVILGTGLYQRAVGPTGSLLVSKRGAEWIKLANWPSPRTSQETLTHTFRLDFFLAIAPSSVPATIETLGRHRVRVNGELLPDKGTEGVRGRHTRELDLAPFLAIGSNEIVVDIERATGRPALLFHAEGAEVTTGEKAWVVSADASIWERASLASEKLSMAPAGIFRSSERIPRALPWMSLLFGVGFMGMLFVERSSRMAALRTAFEPSNLRWLCFAGWLTLSANNLTRLDLQIGFDAPQHYDYVRFLLRNSSVPFADDGWQMFQPPLAYVLAAPLFSALTALAGSENAQYFLRILPLACGMAQIELCYRAGRAVFPERSDLQRLVILIGGFLPMNVYISQTFGNEPVSGLLTAGVVVICLKLLAGSALSLPRASLVLGLLFGLALLAKVSAVVLLPAIALCLLWTAQQHGMSRMGTAGLIARTLLVASGVAGWYYVRNFLYFGRPFVGGWDPLRGWSWWQDPSYRVPADFYTFGAALTEPIHAAIYSLWDGLYSTLWLDGYLSAGITPLPTWNYDFLISMSVLSIPMSIALLTAIVRTLLGFQKPEQRPMLFSVTCVASFAAAMVLLYLEVPSYSTAKATYALGITPCIALLCAAGLAPALGSTAGRALVSGYVSCWLGINYAAYFAH